MNTGDKRDTRKILESEITKSSLLFYCHRRQVGSYEELHIKNSGQKEIKKGGTWG
jgi:hypothetical protein